MSFDKVAVIGAGIVGVPMAAMLADAKLRPGSGAPSKVVLIQRDSPTSGWKVAALNEGKNPLGGIEPELEDMIARTAAAGLLRASAGMAETRDSDAVLVCVQTDKTGTAPEYAPLFEALDSLGKELLLRPAGRKPLIVIESTLAPTTMTTLIRTRFAAMGLVDGRDILLGHSPNRVMPGRLIERIREADKILSGLRPETADLINELYGVIVTGGRLHRTNSLTAETVKTVENAYRDVRIALAAEIAGFCDEADIDFHALRSEVNIRSGHMDGASLDPTAVPTGGLLVPTVGVGGHCLPKDGILLLWRMIEAGGDVSRSLILHARRINDASPASAAARIERLFGHLHDASIALLGAAYRPGAADTRNSPALALGRILKSKCRAFTLHDPFVRREDPRLIEAGLADFFTSDIGAALKNADIVVIGTAHPEYRREGIGETVGPSARAVFDAAHLFTRGEFASRPQVYEGVGKGRREPTGELIEDAVQWLRAVELGIANELNRLISFLNDRYGGDDDGRVDFENVRTLAATCATGCVIAAPGFVGEIPAFRGFQPSLPVLAAPSSGIRT